MCIWLRCRNKSSVYIYSMWEISVPMGKNDLGFTFLPAASACRKKRRAAFLAFRRPFLRLPPLLLPSSFLPSPPLLDCYPRECRVPGHAGGLARALPSSGELGGATGGGDDLRATATNSDGGERRAGKPDPSPGLVRLSASSVVNAVAFNFPGRPS